MRRVIKYETSDGVLHASEQDAERHADKRYGDLLSKTAHELCQTYGKYGALTHYIDENLPVFLQLHALREDMKLVRPSAEDDDDDDDDDD